VGLYILGLSSSAVFVQVLHVFGQFITAGAVLFARGIYIAIFITEGIATLYIVAFSAALFTESIVVLIMTTFIAKLCPVTLIAAIVADTIYGIWGILSTTVRTILLTFTSPFAIFTQGVAGVLVTTHITFHDAVDAFLIALIEAFLLWVHHHFFVR